MKRAITGTIFTACAGWLAFGQSAEAPPKFEIADVHPSAKTTNPRVRSGLVPGGRYEVRNATMADLVGIAYGLAADKVFGGPSWLELDRFDITAKAPAASTPDTQKAMLQALLAERFKLVAHMDTKPLPALTLTSGKRPQLKEAGGSEQTGCKLQPGEAGSAAFGRVMFANPDGTTTTLNLGPGLTILYKCRNMTMAAFADGLHTMLGSPVGTQPVLDETGLKGNWNFDIRYSMPGGPVAPDRISPYEAVDKQLGLKLQEKPVPTPVIVVDSVNRTSSANPPGVAEALPSIPVPTEFEVASMKPTPPDSRGYRYQMQPGGRFLTEGMTLRSLIDRAFNTYINDAVVGVPKFAETDRYDINAKAPAVGPSAPPLEMESVGPMLRALLVDRCKMAYHTEDRPVTAYSLVAAKPKMGKADPESRTYCKFVKAPPGAPPGSRALTCQNATMALLADRLQNEMPELNWPVLDATGIEGGWDFTLTFSRSSGTAMRGPAGGDPGQAADAVPSAAEPVAGYTIFEAIEKQLGLKLEKQKRTLPVIVIDRFEKPTEN
jgi:uncharacterized protein (TIGR03435 family)